MAFGRTAFRHGFVPFLLAFFALSWAYQVEGTRGMQATGLPLDYATFVFLLTVVMLWLGEWVFPLEARWQYALGESGPKGLLGWGELLRDLGYLLVVAQVSAALARLVTTQLEPWLKAQGFGFGLPHAWPTHAPFFARVLLAFLVVEFFNYWMHRAAHRVPLLWRFHATHHAVESLSTLKAVRTHPVDNLFFHLARNLPLLFLGAGPDEVVSAIALGGTLGLLSHANVDVGEGVLGWIVNFPRYHAVHHSIDVEESNTNYGCHTVLFDRLFGTFRERETTPPALGVAPAGRRTLWQELVWPLYRRVD